MSSFLCMSSVFNLCSLSLRLSNSTSLFTVPCATSDKCDSHLDFTSTSSSFNLNHKCLIDLLKIIKSRLTTSMRLSEYTVYDTPTDYRHTDKYLRLVTTPIALCCTRLLKQGNSDVKYDMWHLTLTLTIDLRPWTTIPPWPRSRSTPCQKIKVKGQTVQPGEHGQTRKQTDGRYQIYYLPASRSIIALSSPE